MKSHKNEFLTLKKKPTYLLKQKLISIKIEFFLNIFS